MVAIPGKEGREGDSESDEHVDLAASLSPVQGSAKVSQVAVEPVERDRVLGATEHRCRAFGKFREVSGMAPANIFGFGIIRGEPIRSELADGFEKAESRLARATRGHSYEVLVGEETHCLDQVDALGIRWIRDHDLGIRKSGVA